MSYIFRFYLSFYGLHSSSSSYYVDHKKLCEMFKRVDAKKWEWLPTYLILTIALFETCGTNLVYTPQLGEVCFNPIIPLTPLLFNEDPTFICYLLFLNFTSKFFSTSFPWLDLVSSADHAVVCMWLTQRGIKFIESSTHSTYVLLVTNTPSAKHLNHNPLTYTHK